MAESQNLPEIDLALERIRQFAIGFVKLESCDGHQDASLLGSGSLVRVGEVAGILTAAHVIDVLPEEGVFGLMRFKPFASRPDHFTVEAKSVVPLSVDGWTEAPTGPDLGFLKLAITDVNRLEAGPPNVFLNLQRRKEQMLSSEWRRRPYYDCLCGLPAAWTHDLPPEPPRTLVKGFEGLVGAGWIEREHEANGFDLLDFEVSYGENVQSPPTYKGVSGGGLWRVFLRRTGDDTFELVDVVLAGIAFHQSPVQDSKRVITCHGPESVYGHLIRMIQERWP